VAGTPAKRTPKAPKKTPKSSSEKKAKKSPKKPKGNNILSLSVFYEIVVF